MAVLQRTCSVLILAVVGNGIVLDRGLYIDSMCIGLNPCCSGQWYRTSLNWTICASTKLVLILVVVDNGIVPER